jgi:hypothetical protein
MPQKSRKQAEERDLYAEGAATVADWPPLTQRQKDIVDAAIIPHLHLLEGADRLEHGSCRS